MLPNCMLDTGGEWVIVNSGIGRRVGTFEVERRKVSHIHTGWI